MKGEIRRQMVYRNYTAITLRDLIGDVFHDIRRGFVKDGDRIGTHKAPRLFLPGHIQTLPDCF